MNYNYCLVTTENLKKNRQSECTEHYVCWRCGLVTDDKSAIRNHCTKHGKEVDKNE